MALATEMLSLAGIEGRDPAQTLADGTAMDRFRALIAARAATCRFRCRSVPVRRR
ncbi:Thymidine phosphorylase [Mycobacterium talmoniae]|uniref:Thymidine phosphorylase n=1 Tax=Mycobacterium talmoniae TaxID=1858794 RepID=A0A2S8BG14_9MYCO|nr:Thymidine phosphorylase [Mycobacterium talmoniae]